MAERGWKKLLGQWLPKPPPEQLEPVIDATESNFEQALIRLQQMVEERTFVEVRFPERGSNTFQSLIIKVDPIERVVVIDELFPAHGAFFVSPGDEVEITSVRKGIPVRFSTWIKSIGIDEDDGIPAYKLALPENVDAQQRRKNFRVTIPADAGVRLRIRGPDANKLLCTVQDLSHTGVGFTCQGNLTEHLRTNNPLRNCVLTIPDFPDIGADLDVRSFEFRRSPYRFTVVGARFDNLPPAATKALEQYVVTVQRQRRRDTART